MNFSNIFFNSFQMVDRHLNLLSRNMHNSQTIAVAIFAVANSTLFSFLTLCSTDRRLEGDSLEKWNFQYILTDGMITGLTFAVFNTLLARLTKYPLNTYILTAITISAMVVRMLMIVIKNENKQIEIERELKQQEIDAAATEAKWKAMEAATEKAKIEAEKKAKAEAAEKARIEAEKKAKTEAAKKARIEAETTQKARIEVEKKAKAETTQKARIEAEKKLLLNADIDPELRLLADAVKNGEEKEPFPRLQDYWQNKSVKQLKFRHQFALIFGSDESKQYKAVRKIFADKVYQPTPTENRLSWFSAEEIESQLQDPYANESEKEDFRVFGSGYYYHSTNLEALESILKSGEVIVAAKCFKGAFVSTSPFYSHYPYVLVFKRVIEHLSTLMHGFKNYPDYWAGFAHSIPVNQFTLAHILIKDHVTPKHEMEQLCEKWTSRKIKVIGEKEYFAKWKPKIQALGMGIPSHWEDQMFREHDSHEKVEMHFTDLDHSLAKDTEEDKLAIVA